ncbi:hypothetical protein MTO96_022939 [Rhipicephalus appendiculatus]
MFEINRQNRAAATSVPGASPTPSEPGQLQDMSTVAVPKHSSRRKQKSKLSDDFGSVSSGPSHLQSNGDVIFQRLLTFFTMHQNVNQGERQHAVGGDHSKSETASKCGSKGEDFPAPSTTPNKCKTNITSHNNEHWSRTQCNINASKFAEDQAGSVAEEPIVHLKPEQTPLTEFDVVDIVRQLRDILRKNGPSQEDDLLEALTTSQAQIIINVYGTITAFLDRRPGFEVIYESLYTFVYYKYTDDEDDVLDEGTAVSRTRCSNESGFQYSVAGGDGRRRTRIISSDSPSYTSVMDGGGDKEEKFRMRRGLCQDPWLPPYNSQALQAVEPTREPEVQNDRCYTAIKSTLHKRDLQSSEFKEKLNTTRESQACEAHQLREKIELKKLSSPAPPRALESNVTLPQGQVDTSSSSSWTNTPASAPTSPKGTIAAAKARGKATCACYWTNGPPSAPTASETTPLYRRCKKSHVRFLLNQWPDERPRNVGDHHLSPRRKKSHVCLLLNQWPGQRSRSVEDHHLNPKWKKSHVRFLLNQWPDQRPRSVRDLHLNPKWKKSHVRFLLNQWPDQRPRSVRDLHLNPKWRKSHVRFLLSQWPDQRPCSVGEHRLNPRKKSHVRFLLNQFPDQRPPQRRRSSPHPKVEEKSRAFSFEPTDRPAPPRRRGASPQLKVKEPKMKEPKVEEPKVEEPKVEEKSRARPLEPMTRPAPPQRRRTSPQSKAEEKSRARPLEPIPRPALPQRRRGSPQPKWEEKSRALPLEPMPRPAPPQRRRGSPQPKVEEKSRVLPLAPMPRPASLQRMRASPQPKEVEEKSRALPLEPTAGPAPTKRRRAPPFPRPKAEENPRPFSDVRTSRPTPPIDDKFVRPAKQPAMSECHELSRHRKQVAAACSDVECMPSSQVTSPVKSTAEKQMSKLVQMVKKNKPEYTEQEIRLRLGDLRRSQGGFSRMTLKAIVALMQDRLETEEKQYRHGEDGVSSKEKAGNVFFLRVA